MSSSDYPDSIAFVGAGNMASAIAGGLIHRGYPAASIAATDPSRAALEKLGGLGVTRLGETPDEVIAQPELLVLAVKPQIMRLALANLAPLLGPDTIVLSIAAGIPCAVISEMLGDPSAAIVRCMPNTPALVGEGATGMYAPDTVSARQRQQAEAALGAVGHTLWVKDEVLPDSVTALSGSGPAYVYAFMEAMIASGTRLGLAESDAAALALQTVKGAARLATEQDISIEQLRRNVTSPGGTTQAALEAFSGHGLGNVVDTAMQACFDRAQSLAKEYQ